MAVLEQLPEQAPIDLIVGSRELLRGKVRSRRFMNVAKSTLLAVVFTFVATMLSSDDVGVAKVNYWMLTTAAVVAGFVLGSVDALRRKRSAQRQQQAIDEAWRSARGDIASTRSTRLRWILVGLVIGILLVAFVLAFTFSNLPHVYLWIVPVFGLDSGMWATKSLMTFRWATWYGPGAIDPDVAKQLVGAHNKAVQVQRNSQIYAQTHPPVGEQSS